MCNPVALMAMSAATGLYSAATGAAASRTNAALSRYEADQTREIGRYNEYQARDRMSALLARQRGQLAARGVRLDSATALDLGEAAGKQNAAEAAAIRMNTDTAVTAKSNEATIADWTATTGMMNGVFGTGAKALGQSLDLWPQLAGA